MGAGKLFKNPKSAKKKPTFGKKVEKAIIRFSEKKFLVTLGSSVDSATGGVVTFLTHVPQGAEVTERDGQKIQPTSFKLDYLIKQHATAVSTQVRIIIFIWKLDDSLTTPTTAMILQGSGTVPNWLVAPYEQVKSLRARFTVLYDRMHLLTDTGGNQAAKGTTGVIGRKRLPAKITFASSVNTGIGHIYLLHLTNEATNLPDVTTQSLFKYVDL